MLVGRLVGCMYFVHTGLCLTAILLYLRRLYVVYP